MPTKRKRTGSLIVSSRFKELRKRIHVTQEGLALLMGHYTVDAVRDIEQGYRYPTIDELLKLVNGLKKEPYKLSISTDWLLGLIEAKTPDEEFISWHVHLCPEALELLVKNWDVAVWLNNCLRKSNKTGRLIPEVYSFFSRLSNFVYWYGSRDSLMKAAEQEYLGSIAVGNYNIREMYALRIYAESDKESAKFSENTFDSKKYQIENALKAMLDKLYPPKESMILPPSYEIADMLKPSYEIADMIKPGWHK